MGEGILFAWVGGKKKRTQLPWTPWIGVKYEGKKENDGRE